MMASILAKRFVPAENRRSFGFFKSEKSCIVPKRPQRGARDLNLHGEKLTPHGKESAVTARPYMQHSNCKVEIVGETNGEKEKVSGQN